jgi:hypothetical protein
MNGQPDATARKRISRYYDEFLWSLFRRFPKLIAAISILALVAFIILGVLLLVGSIAGL